MSRAVSASSSEGSDSEELGDKGEALGFDELFSNSEPDTREKGSASSEWCSSGDARMHRWSVDEGMDTVHAQVFDEIGKSEGVTDLEALPEAPRNVWVPKVEPREWANNLFAMMPGPLQMWGRQFDGLSDWEVSWERHTTVLPELTRYAKNFQCGERREAVATLFASMGLLQGVDADMFDHLLCKFDPQFGHVQFGVDQEVGVIRFVMSIADCFYSLIDDRGFSDALFWGVEPMVRDPEQFVAGGVHEPAAKQAWAELPGVSSYVLHWIQHKVWFKKKEHVIDQHVKNAAAVTPGSKNFEEEKFQFLDGKIEELLKCGAVERLPRGVVPDVLTRLSLAPKPGAGKDPWRIIMDMRPENARHFSKVVRMEHLAHFPSVFSAGLLLFSLDLKSAYFSVSVDERLARTMGFEWGGHLYKFKCLPFGFKLAPYVFVKIGRQVVKKWRDQGPGDWRVRFHGWSDAPIHTCGVPCMLYIDDSAGGQEHFGMAVFLRNAMMIELEMLGFSLSAKGSLLPFPQLEFLGMLAHLASPTPSWFLPARKVQALTDLAGELAKLHGEGKQVLCRMAAKCVGKLVSASRAVPVSKLLFREVNACIYASKQPVWGGSIQLSKAAVQDLLWIVKCFVQWNGQCSPIWLQSRVVPVDCTLIQDAGPRAVGFSMRGVAGVSSVDAPGGLPTEGGKSETLRQGVLEVATSGVHSFQSTEGTIELTDDEAMMHHVHKELWGVFLAVASRRWELQDRRVCVLVDATTTVAYLSNWGGPSLTCNRMVKKLWGLCAVFNIRIVQISHIAGSVMITSGVDALSRPYRFARGKEMDRDDWRLREAVFQNLQHLLGTSFTVDRMATRANRRCIQFCSHSSVDPECFGVSAFSVDWKVDKNGEEAVNYCFPPFYLIARILEHVKECKSSVALLVPWWPSQHWWPDLMRMCTRVWRFPVEEPLFERVKDGEWSVVTGRLSFEPIVCVVDCRSTSV